MVGFAERYTPATGAARFQQGTPALEPIYSARAGLRLVLEVGVEPLRARSLALTGRMHARATEAGLAVVTPRDSARRGGMLVLGAENTSEVVEQLAAEGIDIDSRKGAGLRVAPHPCSTEEECDRVIDAIARRVRA
jgi:kynureninase